ncbi:MAG: carboxylesterase/lipase family protein [Clostridia bacterium]|nr:carboxylesterase/lipase family protein [Clostridia bacterium]
MERTFLCNNPQTVVETTRGKILGYVTDGIHVFKGIPYATAKRFRQPEPVAPWQDVLDATSFGFVCPLLETPRPNGELFVPHRYWPMDEDCLNLNVWTPACDHGKRPVLVWLHGGAYESGSAIEHIAYEGENLARYGDVVMVSVNHRLNVLGYFDLSAYGDEYANSANAGDADIVAALQWVHDNIDRFGGSPDNVTIFGQSGGGGKVTDLLQTPAADGLYAKAFNMSGVFHSMMREDVVNDGKSHVEYLLKELGLNSVQELELVPYPALAAAFRKLKADFSKAGKYYGNLPIPNEYYLGEPVKNGFRKETAQVPMLVSWVFGELVAFSTPEYDRNQMSAAQQKEALEKLLGKEEADSLIQRFAEAYPHRPAIDILRSDYLFRPDIVSYVRERSKVNPNTWVYLFDHDMPIYGGQVPWHCADIPYVFHNTCVVPTMQEKGTALLEERLFQSLIAFAKTGDPNNAAVPEWPRCTPTEEYVMVFDTETRVLKNFDHALLPELQRSMMPLFLRQQDEKMAKVQH